MKRNETILYFGIHKPKAVRDKIFLEALKSDGARIIECVDETHSVSKYFRLFFKLISFRRQYDLIWVGWLQGFVIPIAKFATRKKIIYNAPYSMFEAQILDREQHSKYSPFAWAVWLVDFIAFHLSDTVLLESESQARFIAKTFFVRSSKLFGVFSPADSSFLFPDESVKKSPVFTVFFRGMFIPATGVRVVLESAKLLKNESIQFWVSGWGQLRPRVEEYIAQNQLQNVKLNTVFLPPDELRKKLLSAHVMLGQFSSHSRLDRTIQHKTIEALALGMPYITVGSISNRELLTDGEDCLFVRPNDPEAIARAIIRLKDDKELRERLSHGALETYRLKVSPRVVGAKVVDIVQKCLG